MNEWSHGWLDEKDSSETVQPLDVLEGISIRYRLPRIASGSVEWFQDRLHMTV